MRMLQRIPIPAVFFAGVLIVLSALVMQAVRDDRSIATIVFAVAYLVWLVTESRVALSRPGAEAQSDDRGTGQAIIVARMANLGCALLVPPVWTRWHPWMLALMALFAVGVAVRRSAISTLGRFYSRRVRTLTDHRIVTTGPYRFVRHPAYTGVILAHASMTIVLLNAASAVTLLAMVIPAFLWRISVEERLLLQMPGYAEFAQGRRRLFPYVW